MNTKQAIAIKPILINGQEITIRPIRHDDTSLKADFIGQLSAQAKHYRFFGGIRQLSDSDLRDLCDVDYHDSMAFVALTKDALSKSKEKTREIGVVRYAKDDAGSHEMALTIADDFRQTTLGRTLTEYLIAYAKKHQVKVLYSIDLNDNVDMRNLAEQLGMSVRLDPDDAHQVIYSLSVDEHPETVIL